MALIRFRRRRDRSDAGTSDAGSTGDGAGESAPVEDIPHEVIAKHVETQSHRRTFGPPEREELFGLLATADAVVPLEEALGLAPRPRRLIALRHDMDHDIENSVRLAELEHEHGFRASYYVLHTDWHYRVTSGADISPYVLRGLDRIASLGHEVALHNNVLTVALLTGQDPVEVLAGELEQLRRHGFECRGTVAHGDPLCHVGRYVNYEIFSETPRPNLGRPDRVIVYDDPKTGDHHELRLQPVSMREFGLRYEANFIRHDLYLSESGGAWVKPVEEIKTPFVAKGGLLQILTHPVWWALQGESYKPKPPRSITLVGERK